MSSIRNDREVMRQTALLERAYDRWDRRLYALGKSQDRWEHRQRTRLLEEADALVETLTQVAYGRAR